jgi:rubrerythrin
MLTALGWLILVALLMIWRNLASIIRHHATSAKAASEQTNKYLAQIEGGIGGIRSTILELWACPTCGGSGQFGGLVGAVFSDIPPGKPSDAECPTCNGTGRRNRG